MRRCKLPEIKRNMIYHGDVIQATHQRCGLDSPFQCSRIAIAVVIDGSARHGHRASRRTQFPICNNRKDMPDMTLGDARTVFIQNINQLISADDRCPFNNRGVFTQTDQQCWINQHQKCRHARVTGIGGGTPIHLCGLYKTPAGAEITIDINQIRITPKKGKCDFCQIISITPAA